MKKNVFIIVLIMFLGLALQAQDKGAFKIYTEDGNEVLYSEMLTELSKTDVTFFGELHNNPISHWLELKIAKVLYDYHGDALALGAEMFETDQQLVLDEYTTGLIPEKKFEEATHFWPNYESDYKPLVDFAAKNNLRFVATNVPRRYASLVFRKGFESLEKISDPGKELLPPLPIPYDPDLKSYKKMMKMSKSGPMSKKLSPNLPKAQALKDACMAYSIGEAMNEGDVFLHFNGAFHSEYHEGIVWYLMHYKPHLKKETITTVVQDDISSLEEQHEGKADYIIVVDSDMTSSY
ncbi:MAG: ChaN family lipoprotein [Bacteroidota bacterium]|nr:ChaN family lipoprotein [Bacteroidota bacterium]